MSLVSKSFILGRCSCGCLEEIPIKNKRNELGRFKKAHVFKGEKSPNFKTGIRKQSLKGYTETMSPNHPYKNSHDCVMTHRLVVEEHYTKKWGYKFYIHPDLDVHHINRNPRDNRIENLMIVTFKQHMLIHGPAIPKKDYSDRKCLVCGRNKTTFNKKKNTWRWYKYQNGFLCQTHYDVMRLKRKRCLTNLS